MDLYQENKLNEGSDDQSSKEIEKMKESPSKSGDNKLKDALDVESSAKPVAPMRECEFCGKKFSSGKALGGHKRFHLQAQRKERELANKANNCDGNNGGGSIKLFPLNSDERLRCYICNKDFPSEKSLFGHMRSHPDRDWRGVHPPTSLDDKETQSCSPNSDNSMEWNDNCSSADAAATKPTIDISKSLPPTWLKTDIRGRESLWVEAVRVLVSLVDELHNNVNLQQDGDFDSDKLNSEDGGNGKNEDGDEKEEEFNWIKKECCLNNMKGALDGMKTRVTNHAGHVDERVVMMEESKKRKLIVRFKTHHYSEHEDEKNLETLLDGYQCNICNESFPTFQGLRGHRSSHNKEKNKSMMDDQRPSNNIGESSQAGSKTPRNFDLNELPDNIKDEET